MSFRPFCDICREFLILLIKYNDRRIRLRLIDKNDLNLILGFVNMWSVRQCSCCFRDFKYFVYFNHLVQLIIDTFIYMLKYMISKTYEHTLIFAYFYEWNFEDKEKLFLLAARAFQTSLPLYVVCKHLPYRIGELSSYELMILTNFCDINYLDMPLYLMQKILFFIEFEGFRFLSLCFRELDSYHMPLYLAHPLVVLVQVMKTNVKVTCFNDELVEFRNSVIDYLYRIHEYDLRMFGFRSLFEIVWSNINDCSDLNLFGLDLAGLNMAFKLFTSSTLTMRLAGLAYFTEYVNIYNDSNKAFLNPNFEKEAQQLMHWIINYRIVEEIFGPNSHIELIKRSHLILSFISSKLTHGHIDLIWSFAQLMHYEKYIFDILGEIVKKCEIRSLLYLYHHLYQLSPKDHNKHSLDLVSSITKYVWSYNHILPDINPNWSYMNYKNSFPQEDFSCDTSIFNESSVSSCSFSAFSDEYNNSDESEVPNMINLPQWNNYKRGENENYKRNENRDYQRNENEDYESEEYDPEREWEILNKRNENEDYQTDESEEYDPECEWEILNKRSENGDYKWNKNGDYQRNETVDYESEEYDLEREWEIQNTRNKHDYQMNENVDYKWNENEDYKSDESEEYDPEREWEIQNKWNENEDYQRTENGDYQSDESEEYDPEREWEIQNKRDENKDYQRNKNGNYQRNKNGDYLRNENRDYKLNENEDYQKTENGDYQKNKNGDYKRNKKRDFQWNENGDYKWNENGNYIRNENEDYKSDASEEYDPEREWEIQNKRDENDEYQRNNNGDYQRSENGDYKSEEYDPEREWKKINCLKGGCSNSSHRNSDFERKIIPRILPISTNRFLNGSTCNKRPQSPINDWHYSGELNQNYLECRKARYMTVNTQIVDKKIRKLNKSYGHVMVCKNFNLKPKIKQVNDQLRKLKIVFSHKKSYTNGDDKKVNEDNDYFRISEICIPGQTLLWDLLQDNFRNQFSEEMAEIVENTFWSTVYCASNAEMRLQFISGCIDNLANNYSVLTSIRLLQKLLSSFYPYDENSTSTFIILANQHQNMIKSFFLSLKCFMSSYKLTEKGTIVFDFTSKFFSYKDEIRIRLNFLSFIFTYVDVSELSFFEGDINDLWNVFVSTNVPEIVDEFFNWFLVNMVNRLNNDVIEHILRDKIAKLSLQCFTLTALKLLNSLLEYLLCQYVDYGKIFDEMLQLLWSLAFYHWDNQVAFDAITYLNRYYINFLSKLDNTFDREEEYIHMCTRHLDTASKLIFFNYHRALFLIERAVTLLKIHLEVFSAQYSYYCRMIQLSSRDQMYIHRISHTCQSVLDITVTSPFNHQFSIELSYNDYCGHLKAEIQFRWQSIFQKHFKLPMFGNPDRIFLFLNVLDRQIFLHRDEKRLSEIGFKVSQRNYVSFVLDRYYSIDSTFICSQFTFLSNFREKNPNNILSQPKNLEGLFTLLHRLDIVHLLNFKARNMSRYIWEIIQLLPTSKKMFSKIDYLLTNYHTKVNYSECKRIYQQLFPLNSNPKVIYSCQMVIKFKEVNPGWTFVFIKTGGVSFLYQLLTQKIRLQRTRWQIDCLTCIIETIFEFMTYFSNRYFQPNILKISEIHSDKGLRLKHCLTNTLIPFNPQLLSLIKNKENLLRDLILILNDVVNHAHIVYSTMIWTHAQVVHSILKFITSWCFADLTVFPTFLVLNKSFQIVRKLVITVGDYRIRKAACRMLSYLCLGAISTRNICCPFIEHFFELLTDFLEYAVNIHIWNMLHGVMVFEERANTPGNKHYFKLLCEIVTNFPRYNPLFFEKVNFTQLCLRIGNCILYRNFYEKRRLFLVDESLKQLLDYFTTLIRSNPKYKYNPKCHRFLHHIFRCLFELPTSDVVYHPKFKSFLTRSAAFDLLVEITKNCVPNLRTLASLMIHQHQSDLFGRFTIDPWEYWPHDNTRRDFVGLTNLGATCYLASCMQHLFMLPMVRNAILATDVHYAYRHHSILYEMQKMFTFLQVSERKAYNPKNFCRVYIMDYQPLNICEQKDMTEFFTDLISKMEEMTLELRCMVKNTFSGLQSNSVVSLDCPHVSQTTEEFYTLRCQVTDMNDLYQSLNEFTIIDTLDGENMYNCYQCGKKVRAEKRACIKKLPKILCFNTMRYTFNMLTMTKEKVNTHFSFPFTLDMAPYLEKNLLSKSFYERFHGHHEYYYRGYESSSTKYELVGVTVHTGTAEGGHYYSFIQDRDVNSATRYQWFLFNDAEVKPFHKSNLPFDCSGGEITSYAYVNGQFFDFSFEKTNSAYMLFYERCDERSEYYQISPFSLYNPISTELLHWVWNDNTVIIHDRLIYDHLCFDFLWQVCSNVPTLFFQENVELTTFFAQVALTFVLKILINSRKKSHIFGWIKLLGILFNNSQSACEWFMDYVAQNDALSLHIWFKCSFQTIRQLYYRLCILAITKLSFPNYYVPMKNRYYCFVGDTKRMPNRLCSHVKRFISRQVFLLYCDASNFNFRYLNEYFTLLFDFAKLGLEECRYLISINIIPTMVYFYINLSKIYSVFIYSFNDYVEDDFDERLKFLNYISEDKNFRIVLNTMLDLVIYLVEQSRGISKRDFEALTIRNSFKIIEQQVRDNNHLMNAFKLLKTVCNIHSNLSFHLSYILCIAICRSYYNRNSFFKIMSLFSTISWDFMRSVIPKMWQLAYYVPFQTFEWLIEHLEADTASSLPVRHYILNTLDKWLASYLIDTDQPIWVYALLIRLVSSPNSWFSRHFLLFHAFPSPFHYFYYGESPLSYEATDVLTRIVEFLNSYLKLIKKYVQAHSYDIYQFIYFFQGYAWFFVNSTGRCFSGINFNTFWSLFYSNSIQVPIAMNVNKPAFLLCFYLALREDENFIRGIVSNERLYEKICYNYVMLDHRNPHLKLYNKNSLPYYYATLRTCCQYSLSFTRFLTFHPNMQWAFKNIIPHGFNYITTVEELFRLIEIFVTTNPNSTKWELRRIIYFKEATIKTFLFTRYSNMHCKTLSWVMKMLIETFDDKICVVRCHGLSMILSSFNYLYCIHHIFPNYSTLEEIFDFLQIATSFLTVFERYPIRELKRFAYVLVGFVDIHKLIYFLNTHNPLYLRCLVFDVLFQICQVLPCLFSNNFTQYLLLKHISFVERRYRFVRGPYFLRRGHKVHHFQSSLGRLTPNFQMFFTMTNLETTLEYRQEVIEYSRPYYCFVVDLCRFAMQTHCLTYQMIGLTIQLANESFYFKSNPFPMLWLEICNYYRFHCPGFIFILKHSHSFHFYFTNFLLNHHLLLVDTRHYQLVSFFIFKIPSLITSCIIKHMHSLIYFFIANGKNLLSNNSSRLTSHQIRQATADLLFIFLIADRYCLSHCKITFEFCDILGQIKADYSGRCDIRKINGDFKTGSKKVYSKRKLKVVNGLILPRHIFLFDSLLDLEKLVFVIDQLLRILE